MAPAWWDFWADRARPCTGLENMENQENYEKIENMENCQNL